MAHSGAGLKLHLHGGEHDGRIRQRHGGCRGHGRGRGRPGRRRRGEGGGVGRQRWRGGWRWQWGRGRAIGRRGGRTMVGGANAECGWAVGVNRGARPPWSSEARRRAEGRAPGGDRRHDEKKRETETFFTQARAGTSGGYTSRG
jgi:hypothetical protein